MIVNDIKAGKFVVGAENLLTRSSKSRVGGKGEARELQKLFLEPLPCVHF
jgi:hypothetical protein